MDEVREPPLNALGDFVGLDLEAGAWKIAADALPTAVFTTSPGGDVEFVNRAWFKLTGYETSEPVLEERWPGLVHPDDLPRVRAAWDDALSTGEPFEIQHRIRKADGTYRWIFGRALPVRAVDGTIVRWYGTATDIQEWKDAERQLFARELQQNTSERSFRALAEAAPVILWTATADGWIDWYNERWYEYTGQTRAEASGWGWQSAHHPEDFPEVMRRWPESIATGQPFEMEFRLHGADGTFRWFLTRIHPLRDGDGTILRWYGSNVDIDAQRKERDRSLRIAQTLQQVFLPKRLPHTDAVRFDAVYMPAEKDALVGGDWYDAFELDDGRIAFSIGDVGGHGLDASVVAGSVRQAIFALSLRIDDPVQLLREVNRVVLYQAPETLVTALVGFIDPSQHVVRYASAGHPPPLVAYRGDEPALELPYGGIPLGVRADLGDDLRTTVVPICADMIIALYTDGLTEASRDIASAERELRELIPRFVGNVSILKPADAVLREMLRGTPALDDAAVMLIQFSHVSAKLLERAPLTLQKTWRFHSSDAYTAHTSRQELTAYFAAMAADPNETFSAELVLGEILANTVEHAPGLVEIHIDWTDEKPVVHVRDTGPGLVGLSVDLPDDPLDENGRGMFLIRALAEDVVVQPASGFGTELRATLSVKRTMPRQ